MKKEDVCMVPSVSSLDTLQFRLIQFTIEQLILIGNI